MYVHILKFFGLSLLLVISAYACKNDLAKQEEGKEETGIEIQPVEQDQGGTEYPTLPQNIINNIIDSLDIIDIIFYDVDASMTAEGRESALPFMNNISTTSPPSPSRCKPNGRVSFMGHGELIAEADFFFSPNCAFFIFLVDNQYRYANMMTAKGVSYFKQVYGSAVN